MRTNYTEVRDDENILRLITTVREGVHSTTKLAFLGKDAQGCQYVQFEKTFFDLDKLDELQFELTAHRNNITDALEENQYARQHERLSDIQVCVGGWICFGAYYASCVLSGDAMMVFVVLHEWECEGGHLHEDVDELFHAAAGAYQHVQTYTNEQFPLYIELWEIQ